MIEPVAKNERTFMMRLFERIPGILFFALLFFFFLGPLVIPEVTAYAIIVINVYFLYKSATMSIAFVLSYSRIRKGEGIDWQVRLNELSDPQAGIEHLKLTLAEINDRSGAWIGDQADRLTSKSLQRLPRFLRLIVARRERQKLNRFLRQHIRRLKQLEVFADWRQLQHIVIIPHVKEPEHILRSTLSNLAAQKFPVREQLNIVLAAEARDPNGLPMSEKLAAEFAHVFKNIWVSNHILKPEEAVGKSSNMKAGGEVAFANVQKLGWDLKQTLITSCDADSKLPDQYFAYVSYEFVTRALAEYKIFNAALVFYNNIWRLPFYARVKNSMSTMVNTARLVRTDKLVPFSTYTTSFWLIKEIGFWTPWVTPEDFHLFFKAQFKFGSIVSAVPIYLRIMSDAAEGKGHIDTIRNNYMQERRWSWGVSDDGWVLQNIFLGDRHDFVTIYRGLHSVADHIISPVLGLLLIVGGNIPPLLNPAFSGTVLGAQLPQISSVIITISLAFMVVMVLLDLTYRPHNQGGLWLPFEILKQLLEWLIFPVASFMLAVLPGVEANTRLLFGRYLEYYVTKKQ